jgi:hypothetical protein
MEGTDAFGPSRSKATATWTTARAVVVGNLGGDGQVGEVEGRPAVQKEASVQAPIPPLVLVFHERCVAVADHHQHQEILAFASRSVTSNSAGSLVSLEKPAWVPLTYTSKKLSALPTWRIVLRPFHVEGTENVRRYTPVGL